MAPRNIRWEKTGKRTWEVTLSSNAELTITNGHVHYPNQWVAHLRAEGALVVDTHVLRAARFETAAREAVRVAKSALKVYEKIGKKLDRVVPVVLK